MPKKPVDAVVQIGERGRGTPGQIFKFLLKSILGVFSNVEVKCHFILIKLTG